MLGGVGPGLARHRTEGEDSPIVHALLTGNLAGATELAAKGSRASGKDLKALAVVHEGPRRPSTRDVLARMTMPVLFVSGANDTPVGDPQPIADTLPNARVVFIPARDHLTVVGDKRFKDAAVQFLATV